MQALLWLVCGALLSAYMLLWVRQRRARTLLAHLPSYPQLPLVGNLLQLMGDGRSLHRLLDHMSQKSDEMFKPFVIWIGSIPNIIISDPDDVKTVTNAFIEKPYYYTFGKIWLGNSLITAPGFIWKQNVKKLGNMFNSAVVDGYQSVFNEQAHRLVEILKKQVGKEPWDMLHLLTYTTLETICHTALGTARISDSVMIRKYYDAFNQCLMLLTRRGLSPWLHPDCVYRLTRDYEQMQKHVAVVHSVSRTVLEKRKKERQKVKNSLNSKSCVACKLLELPNMLLKCMYVAVNCADSHIYPEAIISVDEKKFKSVLDILLDLSESDPQLTEQQVRHEVDAIVVGGQETTASTLFYALLIIGARPTVQEKLYTELENIFGGTSRPVQRADLQRMQYCEAVIHETLRLFPPLPAVIRYADRELQLKSCRIPKGTGCAINAWGAGRSKRTWGPDALEFDPDRWLDGRAPTNPSSFLPFSYGRRACIGKKYAIALLKTVLAYCVRELRFISEADKLELKVDIALRPVSGHLMQLELRK